MTASLSPLALARVKAQGQLHSDIRALKTKEETDCDAEIVAITAKTHRVSRSRQAIDAFNIKPWRLELAELRLENAHLKKNLDLSQEEIGDLRSRAASLESRLEGMQKTIVFYGSLIDTYQDKLGPDRRVQYFQTDRLYDE